MSDVTFGSLPPIARTKTRQTKYDEFATAAREHPGEWGLLGSGMSATTVKTINDGKWEEFPAGEYQAASRNSSGGKADVYVRFFDGTTD